MAQVKMYTKQTTGKPHTGPTKKTIKTATSGFKGTSKLSK